MATDTQRPSSGMYSNSVCEVFGEEYNNPFQFSVFIPRVFSNISEHRVRSVFRRLNIGEVTAVSLARRPDGNANMAFVYFASMNYDNPVTNTLIDKICDSEQTAKIMYEEPYYWVVLPNKTGRGTTYNKQFMIFNEFRDVMFAKFKMIQETLDVLEFSKEQLLRDMKTKINAKLKKIKITEGDLVRECEERIGKRLRVYEPGWSSDDDDDEAGAEDAGPPPALAPSSSFHCKVCLVEVTGPRENALCPACGSPLDIDENSDLYRLLATRYDAYTVEEQGTLAYNALFHQGVAQIEERLGEIREHPDEEEVLGFTTVEQQGPWSAEGYTNVEQVHPPAAFVDGSEIENPLYVDATTPGSPGAGSQAPESTGWSWFS
jgi:hypothetical protein